MEQQNISIYKDNDDLYIRIRNCPENLNELLMKMFEGLMGNNEIKPKELENVKPINNIIDEPAKMEDAEANTEEKVFTWGAYKGMKPTEILNKIGKDKAFVFFSKQKTIYDKVLKENVSNILTSLKKDLHSRLCEEPSYDDMNVFFREYRSLFEDDLKEFMSDKYETIEDMLKSFKSNGFNEDVYDFYIEKIKEIIN